jgi:hypothetical protein
MAAMLDDMTKEANKKFFVNVLQHGGDDVTCNRRIAPISLHQKPLAYFHYFILNDIP